MQCSLPVEVDPTYQGSDEVRDVRDPRALVYMDQLTELSLHTEKVIGVTSPTTVLKNINNGRLPQSEGKLSNLQEKTVFLIVISAVIIPFP